MMAIYLLCLEVYVGAPGPALPLLAEASSLATVATRILLVYAYLQQSSWSSQEPQFNAPGSLGINGGMK